MNRMILWLHNCETMCNSLFPYFIQIYNNFVYLEKIHCNLANRLQCCLILMGPPVSVGHWSLLQFFVCLTSISCHWSLLKLYLTKLSLNSYVFMSLTPVCFVFTYISCLSGMFLLLLDWMYPFKIISQQLFYLCILLGK